MKKPAMPAPVNLPYASTAASFFGDQGTAGGNSFIGRMFSGMAGRQTQVQTNPTNAPTSASGAVNRAAAKNISDGHWGTNNRADR